MATITGQQVADRASTILKDASPGVRWAQTGELLLWINDAQREIALLKPNTYTTTANITLVAGTKQTITSGYHALVAVVRNMGTGSTPGRAVIPLEREHLDVAFPNWHASTYAKTTVKGFCFDEKDPKTFYVYPPQPAGTSQTVEAKLSGPPTALTTLASTLTLDDVYAGAVLDYVLYRAFSKDTESVPSAERAALHYRQFAQSLGIRTQVERAYAPEAEDVKPGAAAGVAG